MNKFNNPDSADTIVAVDFGGTMAAVPSSSDVERDGTMGVTGTNLESERTLVLRNLAIGEIFKVTEICMHSRQEQHSV